MRQALLILIFGLILTVAGCNLFQAHTSSAGVGGSLVTSGAQIYANTVVKTDYLFAVFMVVAAVGGMIAGMAGLKMGWIVAAGNIGGIVLYLTVARYGQWLALGGLLAAAAVVVAMLLRNRRFQLQHVGAIEELKEKLPDNLRDIMSTTLFKNQDRTTEALVSSMRSILDQKKEKEARRAVRQLKKQRELDRLALRNGVAGQSPAVILEPESERCRES